MGNSDHGATYECTASLSACPVSAGCMAKTSVANPNMRRAKQPHAPWSTEASARLPLLLLFPPYPPAYDPCTGHSACPARHAPTPPGVEGDLTDKKFPPLGLYRRPMPWILGGSQGGGRFLMGEVPLYAGICPHVSFSSFLLLSSLELSDTKTSVPALFTAPRHPDSSTLAHKSRVDPTAPVWGCSPMCNVTPVVLEPFCGHLSPKIDKVA